MSLKRIARDIGISEAQIYNYYKSLAEVLVAIARSELAGNEQGAPFRRPQLHRPQDALYADHDRLPAAGQPARKSSGKRWRFPTSALLCAPNMRNDAG